MIIILVLLSGEEHYLKMAELWKKYMNKHPYIKSYFIKYDSNLNEGDILLDNNNTIYMRGEESVFPGCLDKTIKTIEYFLRENVNFEYIFRTNVSSVVNLDKLYKFISNYKDIECGGALGIWEKDLVYISGAGLLLSKKVCSELVENKLTLNYHLYDDVAIGEFLNRKNYKKTPLTRFEGYQFENNLHLIKKELIDNFYHYRCKSAISHELTLTVMSKIISLIYPDTN